MIEAVNSVLSSGQLLRASIEQSSGTSSSLNIEIDAQGAVDVPKAPFISPYISLDANTNKAVLQIRDSETGDVVRQFPTERSLQVRRAQAVATEVATEARRAPPQTGNTDVSHSVPEVRSSSAGQGGASAGGGIDVAQAQVASQALAAGAQTAVQTQSAGVSVTA